MNWRQFFGWSAVVWLILIELIGYSALVAALYYDYSERLNLIRQAHASLDSLPEPVPASDTLSIIFAGDLMMHMPQLPCARQVNGSYNFDECFQYVSPILKKHDLAIANLETTLPGSGYSGFPKFGSPDAFAESAYKAGFQVFQLANNHCCDRGQHGIVRTQSVLDSLGAKHLGVYQNAEQRSNEYPLLLIEKGIRVVVLCATYGTNGLPVPKGCIVNHLDTMQMYQDIQAAKAMQPDVLIALVHWGEEYSQRPNRHQRWYANWLLSHGVDHIIGGHPHVVQPVEIRPDTLNGDHVIAFSLGNFISSQLQAERSIGLMLSMTFVRDTSGICLVHSEPIKTWVSRPRHSGHRQPRIYPEDYPQDSLNTTERTFRQACLKTVPK